MLFNSYTYILAFLPITLLVYWLLQRFAAKLSKPWLIVASLTFYSWWNPIYLPLILGSILVNYLIGTRLADKGKSWLIAGITFNLVLLAYFKYADFFINSMNSALGMELGTLNIVLPLAISFFTFQQISFLVDSYQGKVTHVSSTNYLLFVTFFPQLIAGPIVHHKEMMPQFEDGSKQQLNWSNIANGIYIFFFGLVKKVAIADTFAKWANAGFNDAEVLNMAEAWITSLSYSLQIYYDFSGYTDMAIGAALMFNIVLPINFNSPYKARNIQDFWRRWHMTLSRFLRDYLYIPLGGNRQGKWFTYRNLFITFLLGGLWHGAAWTFVIWGALHGLALIVHRLWMKTGIGMHKVVAWLITFNFVNMAFVFFRAESFTDAMKVLQGMAGLSGIALPHAFNRFAEVLPDVQFGHFLYRVQGDWITLLYLSVFILLAVLFKNSNQLNEHFKLTPGSMLTASLLTVTGILLLNRISPFLYFQF